MNTAASIDADEKKQLWDADEVRALLSLWGEAGVQAALEASVRNERVYARISADLRCSGISRSPKQCREKVKKLKQEYKRLSEAAAAGRKRSRHYQMLDAVMGRGGGGGGVRSMGPRTVASHYDKQQNQQQQEQQNHQEQQQQQNNQQQQNHQQQQQQNQQQQEQQQSRQEQQQTHHHHQQDHHQQDHHQQDHHQQQQQDHHQQQQQQQQLQEMVESQESEDASSVHSDGSVLIEDVHDGTAAPQAGHSSAVNPGLTSLKTLQAKKRKRDAPDSVAELAKCMRESDERYMEFLRQEMQADRELKERQMNLDRDQRERETEASTFVNRELISVLKQLGHALLAREARDLPLD
ncbi:unnamed protein product [Lampetra planeri]